MKKFEKSLGQKGSMMVEALAMLGLITMVTPILYKKAAERTTELQDINTANQMRTISKAMDDYIKDHYSALATGGNQVKLEAGDLEPYLPYGFNLDDSKLLGDYQIAMRKDTIGSGENSRASITGMVVAKPKADLSMMRASKIASMIGANGGVVQNAADGKLIQGVGGGWNAKEQDYGFVEGDPGEETGTLTAGGIAVGSVHAVTTEGGGNVSDKDVLYRNNSKGTDHNTMETTLYLGDNNIEDVAQMMARTVTVSGVISGGSGAFGGTLTAGDTTVGTLKAGDTTVGGLTAGNTSVGTLAAKDTTVTGTVTASGLVKGDALEAVNDLNVGKLSNLKGAVTIGDTTTESSSANMLTVHGSGSVLGNLTVKNDLRAPNVAGFQTLKGGQIGTTEEDRYNFEATGSQVRIENPDFQVAQALIISNTSTRLTFGDGGPNGLEINGATQSIALRTPGGGLLLNDGGVPNAYLAGAQRLDLVAPNVEINSSGETPLAKLNIGQVGSAGEISGAADAVTLDAKNSGKLSMGAARARLEAVNGASYVELDNMGARLMVPKGGVDDTSVDLTTLGEVKIKGTELSADTNQFYLDKEVLAFADKAKDAAGVEDGSVTSEGIIMRREGMITLPMATGSGKAALNAGNNAPGEQDVAGYIKADRFLSNVHYDKISPNVSGEGEPYDAYQVNPAYTSVMHDIKLTTRGGARLSDILPDFINKGIYVLDNTYKEDKNNPNWENYSVSDNSGVLKVTPELPDCHGSADCIATPWLGFVPAPQCPPGYAKVITINPIRWKMSEAFYITGVEAVDPDVATKFRNYFVPPTNPFMAKFKLGEADGSTGMHSHELSEGAALTFQTNTWLNTTISGYSNGSDFLGWHAIMGFLYYGDQYAEYLQKLGKTGYSGKVIWNLFPVYNEEMSAIANVYCYFDRDNFSSNSKYTGDYNQLLRFQSGFTKNSSYTDRLNDPALKYREVW